jgi:NADPH-dependent curcumin reductase CurA
MSDAKSYIQPFQAGKPIEGSVIARVVESKSDGFVKDDLVVGMLPWSREFIAEGKGLQKIDTSNAHPSYYLGILGMTGLTAYFGLMEIGKPKQAETVVVSGAAGAVGMVVGQIAKIQGCHVTGIAGSDDKIKLLKEEFGFDGAINYKQTADIKAAISEFCPNGVDIYFDNVGGEISDAVIANINKGARIIICGQISSYNDTRVPVGPRPQSVLLTKSALMQGFIVGNYASRFPEGVLQLSEWLRAGKLNYRETIIKGFERLPEAFISLFAGENTGKMLVEIE